MTRFFYWKCHLGYGAVQYVFLRLGKKYSTCIAFAYQKEWPKVHFISYEKICAVLLLSVHGTVATEELDVALKWPTAERYRLRT